MTSVNRLTVDGRDYFLPDPVTELREKILEAIRAGGGYVNIPPLRSGPGIDILFSPGMPVVWTQHRHRRRRSLTDGRAARSGLLSRLLSQRREQRVHVGQRHRARRAGNPALDRIRARAPAPDAPASRRPRPRSAGRAPWRSIRGDPAALPGAALPPGSASVELHLRDRETLELSHRRMSRAEVVQRHPDARGRAARQARHDRVRCPPAAATP